MEESRIHTVGIILNGVTGRMGTRQHLERSILAIRKEGGVKTKSGQVIMPDPILLGRNQGKLKALAQRYALDRFSTSLDEVLSDPYYQVYFDAQRTNLRAAAARKAISAGKAVYCEKPITSSLSEAMDLCRAVVAKGVKNGIVQDKLWLPGLLKLKHLIDSRFFGRILSVRGEFGYWVFDGRIQPCQRPSWNYRREEGGGIIMDMLCHWRYVIDNLFGKVSSVSCLGAIDIGKRIDEGGKEYSCTADDSAYATFLCDNGIVCQFNSSWSVRVQRGDLFTLQVDGTDGSAVAGLHRCLVQNNSTTPRFVWNPDVDDSVDYYGFWQEVASPQPPENAFKKEWELFLRHVIADEPFPWTFIEGAKGVQLAELATKSWKERKWIDVPALSV
jgi:predicted dehydrogenase